MRRHDVTREAVWDWPGDALRLAQVSASAAIQPAPPAAGAASRRSRRPAAPQPPTYLRDRVDALGRGVRRPGRHRGRVRSTRAGQTGWKADELYPQQSVSKLWVAITALDAVDKGRVRLDDKVTLTRGDLTLFHQPIAAQILGGGYTTTLGDLMFKAITDQRQYRQRQADALGRRARRRCAR